VSYLDERYSIKIRKQSLDERFNNRAVLFVRSVLETLIREQFSGLLYSEGFLNTFQHVRIKDSTKFNVPGNLQTHYRGSGGSGSTTEAGICIQYEFDLKTGKFFDLTITEAIRNDRQDAKETVENICKNDLVIRDLGYFSIPVLQTIDTKEAFFLSRLPSSVLVYDEKGTEIDFKKLYASMTKNGIERSEKEVLAGENRMPVRLVFGLVPEHVYQQRLRNKEKEAKKKGHQIKERTKLLLRFNLFITNAQTHILPIEKVMPLYRFRWQIELMFKNWKSVFSIHTLQKMKEKRYTTMLYTRLILIVIDVQIINQLQSYLSEQKIKDSVLSYHKALTTLKRKFSELLSILRSEREKAIMLLENIYRILSKNHWREKRKKRENYIENICLFI